MVRSDSEERPQLLVRPGIKRKGDASRGALRHGIGEFHVDASVP